MVLLLNTSQLRAYLIKMAFSGMICLENSNSHHRWLMGECWEMSFGREQVGILIPHIGYLRWHTAPADSSFVERRH